VPSRLQAQLALGALALAALPLAAPGPALVPAATHTQPRWLLGIYGRGFGLGAKPYLGCLIAAFVGYLAVIATANHLRPRLLWAAIAGLLGLFVLAPPLLSRDVFSYIAYERLEEDGLDPYVSVPADQPTDAVLPFVGWRHTPSVYGPVFAIAAYPLGVIGVAPALWTLKLLSGLAVLALAAVTAHIASIRGGDPQRCAAMVALNPLVLVHVVGGAHNDSLMILAVMGGVALLVSGRQLKGGVALALAFGLKASAIFAIPFAIAGNGRRARLVGSLAVAGAVITAVVFAAFGTDAAAAARLVSQTQALASHYSLPSTIARLTGVPIHPVRAVAVVSYLALVGWLLVWTVRGGDWVRATGWAGFGLLVSSAWLMPWYVIWVLPLAAIARDRVLTWSVLALCAFQLVNRLPL
jgi:hypothetical protein